MERIEPLRGIGEISLAELPRTRELSSLSGAALRISGWSMFPGVFKGDLLELAPADRLEKGDIIVFSRHGSLVCHRIQELRPDGGIVTRGDNASAADSPIRRGDVVGKVAAIRRGKRRLVPGTSPRAGSLDHIRMRTSVLCCRIGARIMSSGRELFLLFKRSGLFRRALGGVLRISCRYYTAVRVPIRALEAYTFAEIGASKDGSAAGSPEGAIVVARTFGRTLASYDPASGRLEVRAAFSGLGIEDRLLRLRRGRKAA